MEKSSAGGCRLHTHIHTTCGSTRGGIEERIKKVINETEEARPRSKYEAEGDEAEMLKTVIGRGNRVGTNSGDEQTTPIRG